MTIATMIERVEAGEIVAIDEPEDVMDVIRWARNTEKSLTGWFIHIDVPILWIGLKASVTPDHLANWRANRP